MRDKVNLIINNQQIENFLSYRVEANLFVADDAFEFSLANPEVTVSRGDQCKLYINDDLELTGIIDVVSKTVDKTGTKLTVKGRDLMGLLTDSYVEEFITLQDYTLKQLAEKLLATVPYVNRKNIIYGKGNKNRAVPLTETEEDFEFQQLDPGRTVFEILKEYALSRGMLFFSLPDGTFVFGQPRTSGAADFTLINCRQGKDNNVIEGEKTDDISRRYSKITVMGQRQGTEVWEAEDTNVTGTMEDGTFPFYKPFVAEITHDGQDPEKYAQILMDKQLFDGFNLSYKTYGHSQAGKNYTINAVCHVEDDALDVNGDSLIYERVFEMDKNQGVFTTLKMSHLGVLPA